MLIEFAAIWGAFWGTVATIAAVYFARHEQRERRRERQEMIEEKTRDQQQREEEAARPLVVRVSMRRDGDWAKANAVIHNPASIVVTVTDVTISWGPVPWSSHADVDQARMAEALAPPFSIEPKSSAEGEIWFLVHDYEFPTIAQDGGIVEMIVQDDRGQNVSMKVGDWGGTGRWVWAEDEQHP